MTIENIKRILREAKELARIVEDEATEHEHTTLQTAMNAVCWTLWTAIEIVEKTKEAEE